MFVLVRESEGVSWSTTMLVIRVVRVRGVEGRGGGAPTLLHHHNGAGLRAVRRHQHEVSPLDPYEVVHLAASEEVRSFSFSQGSRFSQYLYCSQVAKY